MIEYDFGSFIVESKLDSHSKCFSLNQIIMKFFFENYKLPDYKILNKNQVFKISYS